MELIEFLRARLDEDETGARAARDGFNAGWRWSLNPDGQLIGVEIEAAEDVSAHAQAHIARWDPVRVLAEVAAKRQVIEYAEATEDAGLPSECWALGQYMVRALAQPYADHPDFAPAWLLAPA